MGNLAKVGMLKPLRRVEKIYFFRTDDEKREIQFIHSKTKPNELVEVTYGAWV